MVDDTLTARNRINQRNFRARRQNYIKDLEEKLRKYESEGVQATIEIQTAARQVTDQNVKLRALLMSRFGMNDHEIETYLSTHGPPVSIQSSLLPVALTTPPLTKSASDTSSYSGLSSFQSIAPSSQSVLSAAVLSPALGLASLHKTPDQSSADEPVAKRQRHHDHSSHMSITALMSDHNGDDQTNENFNGHDSSLLSRGSHPERQNTDQDPDTMSESSNPHTPAEHLDPMLRSSDSYPSSRTTATSLDMKLEPTNGHALNTITNGIPSYASQLKDSTNRKIIRSTNGTSKRIPGGGDETACEDAARIIASMRGINDERPEQILLELGCNSPTNSESCKVKNLSIFSLMDSR